MTIFAGLPRSAQRRSVTIAAIVVAAVALSTLSLLAVSWITRPASALPGHDNGIGFFPLHRSASAVSLPDLRGHGTVGIAALTGKPIVMNLWSSTCGPCTKETPALASVARSLAGKVAFLGVDTSDTRQHAIAFADKYQVPYPIGFDPRGNVAVRYGVVGLPVTFFLSRSGTRVLGVNVGALTPVTLRTILHGLYGVS